jgi:acyl-coenzyme A thioesterase PaaI-like protein
MHFKSIESPAAGASAAPADTVRAPLQFSAFLKTGLVKDMLFLYDKKQQKAHLVVELGSDVCGHAKVVHGGLLGAICDEAYGALVYSMKHEKLLGAEPAVTASLSVNYRKVCVACTTTVRVRARIVRPRVLCELCESRKQLRMRSLCMWGPLAWHAVQHAPAHSVACACEGGVRRGVHADSAA